MQVAALQAQIHEKELTFVMNTERSVQCSTMLRSTDRFVIRLKRAEHELDLLKVQHATELAAVWDVESSEI